MLIHPLIAQIRDRSLLDLYSRKAVRRIGVDLDIMQREVAYQRRKLNVRDEDAYAPKRRFQNNAGPSAEPAYAERGANPYANPAARKALEHRDAAEQSYYRIDDAVFIWARITFSFMFFPPFRRDYGILFFCDGMICHTDNSINTITVDCKSFFPFLL